MKIFAWKKQKTNGYSPPIVHQQSTVWKVYAFIWSFSETSVTWTTQETGETTAQEVGRTEIDR